MNATLVDQVRHKYALAAREVVQREFSQLTVLGACCGSTGEDGACCSSSGPGHVHEEAAEVFGASVYPAGVLDSLPSLAVSASSGCGHPVGLADLKPGEKVLDLGSGPGVDVMLAARLVGPGGSSIGLDITDEMVALARSAQRSAAIGNADFGTGPMESIELPENSVDVVVSNCALNLSTDKQAALSEIVRVLRPGGRVAICDVVAADALSVEDRASRGSYVDCLAGAMTFSELETALADAGLDNVSIVRGHGVADQMFAASITARRRRAI